MEAPSPRTRRRAPSNWSIAGSCVAITTDVPVLWSSVNSRKSCARDLIDIAGRLVGQQRSGRTTRRGNRRAFRRRTAPAAEYAFVAKTDPMEEFRHWRVIARFLPAAHAERKSDAGRSSGRAAGNPKDHADPPPER
jgi:hypothetical protein